MNIFQIFCVIALFPFLTILESVFHGYSFHTKIFSKCNFRTHFNVGSRTIMIEPLKFRNLGDIEECASVKIDGMDNVKFVVSNFKL